MNPSRPVRTATTRRSTSSAPTSTAFSRWLLAVLRTSTPSRTGRASCASNRRRKTGCAGWSVSTTTSGRTRNIASISRAWAARTVPNSSPTSTTRATSARSVSTSRIGSPRASRFAGPRSARDRSTGRRWPTPRPVRPRPQPIIPRCAAMTSGSPPRRVRRSTSSSTRTSPSTRSMPRATSRVVSTVRSRSATAALPTNRSSRRSRSTTSWA